MSGVSNIDRTDDLDRQDIVISNGIATNESNAYKTEVDSKNRLRVNPNSPFIGRCILNTSVVALEQTYQNFLNLSGQGELMGFKFKVSNGSASVRLEIDGVESFAINFDSARSCNFAEYNNSGLNRYFGTEQYGELEFFPNVPWQFKTSLKVQIKKDVTWNINREKAVVFYAV